MGRSVRLLRHAISRAANKFTPLLLDQPSIYRPALGGFFCRACAHPFLSYSGLSRHHLSSKDCSDWEARQAIAAPNLKRRLEDDIYDGSGLRQRRRVEEEAPPKEAPDILGCIHTRIEQLERAQNDQDVPCIPFNTQPPSSTRLCNGYNVTQPRLTTPDKGRTYVELFPNVLAGSPINNTSAPPFNLRAYVESAGNLSSVEHFDTLELLMTTGLTNKGRDQHLKSRLYRGKTPWKSCADMLSDLDKLPHGPDWNIYDLKVKEKNGREHIAYLLGRNILDVIRTLIGNRAFRHHMRYAPEKHWTSKARRMRVYSEMWTANWWWDLQLCHIDPFATILPLIISSDRTQLSTMCGGQQAYPVFVSLGNIGKVMRRKVKARATMLLGYLPVDTFDDVTNETERQRLKNDLTHRTMEVLMEPLKTASVDGVEMVCADGQTRRTYPTPAAFLGDWPEQCLHACTDQGGCPVCMKEFANRADPTPAPMRTRAETLEAFRHYARTKDIGELDDLKLKPWWPWWASIPDVNISTCLAPDLLHQLYQGMIKTHAVSWSKKSVGVSQLDQSFVAMPRTHGMRHFKKGISKVKQWTGRESKEMAKQLVPAVAGQTTSERIGLIRSVVDFTFRAHKSRITDDDIASMEDALAGIHQYKGALLTSPRPIHDSPARLNRAPKFHMISHYPFFTRRLGTPDGYSTELPENLHIVYAKKGWRASNKVRPLPQMAKFVQRYEALRMHRVILDEYYGIQGDERVEDVRVVYEHEGDGLDDWNEEVEGEGDIEGEGEDEDVDKDESEEAMWLAKKGATDRHVVHPDPDRGLAKHPTVLRLLGHELIRRYGAVKLIIETNKYLVQHFGPEYKNALCANHLFDVWHKFYLRHQTLYFDPDQAPQLDIVRAKPSAPALPCGAPREATFDTVLYLAHPDEFGIHRYRAGLYSEPLVYLERFSRFSPSTSKFHRMHSTSYDVDGERRRQSIVIPLSDVVAACHLAPQFQKFKDADPFRPHDDYLSTAHNFFFNHYTNHFIFELIEHWRAVKAARDLAQNAAHRSVA